MMENILSTFEKVANNERITITALEKKIGASKGVLSRAITQQSDISSKWLLRLVENYPHYNPEWMLTGREPMLKAPQGDGDTGLNRVWTVKGDRRRSAQAIPLYDVEATAGIVGLLHQNAQKHIPIDYIQIPNLPKCDGAIPITGDSMYPLLKSGDIALYKEVHDPQNIIWGEMYLVALSYKGDDFFFAKYVQRSDVQGWVKLVSQNKHHQDKEFPMDSITALALIKASIRINTGF